MPTQIARSEEDVAWDAALSAETSLTAKLDLPDPGMPDTPTSSRLDGGSLLQHRSAATSVSTMP